MFSKVESDKSKFLEQAKVAREERAQDRHREDAAIHIQAYVRGFLSRRRLRRSIREDLDRFLKIPQPDVEYKPELQPAIEVFHLVKKFLFIHNAHCDQDRKRFEYLCRYILASVESDALKSCYVAISCNKQYVIAWIAQLKSLLWTCCQYFYILKPENHNDLRTVMVFLRMLVTFTSHTNWVAFRDKENLHPGFIRLCENVMGELNSKGLYTAIEALLRKGLCRSKPVFNKAIMTAVITISLRPLIAANFSNNLMSMFLVHMLSVPAVIIHINSIAQDCISTLITHRIFKRCLDLLACEQNTRIIFNSLEGNYALCLMANLIQLGFMEMEGLVENTTNFMTVMIILLDNCHKYVLNKKSNLTHWHPVLGWFSQKTDQRHEKCCLPMDDDEEEVEIDMSANH